MILNIILGFIIPWVIVLIIVRERKIIYYLAPFASVLSFIVNDLGFYYFWNLYPFRLVNLSGVPFNIGLFCIYPCISIELMRKYDVSAYIVLPITSLIIALFEGCGVLIGRVVYYNHWNIVATYISYFISLLISYTFYKVLKRKNLI
ncbi:hypothetical protein Ccar_10740 [Clostridium carboxidivorans P7]|uniref:Uncharacterized protein n=1 Tax=Clostridium carboxidivorans P7 TaxID=536227 RepID=C6PNT7_9CLOT|nr:hypothetical protein [Clostridium carboxidivorans]AKN31305.1 hypothetical protein Ccar_10740 [Clostridium carboxidivorans P7]EET89015.1 conserved hypothetical protein [Clostridium carboxidivorans P7]EFG88431.1 hypothetical protein CLCAR_2009 [Clostridium carboxidivorans P7]